MDTKTTSLKFQVIIALVLVLPTSVIGSGDVVGKMSTHAPRVSMISLLSNPTAFIGKKISTTGFLYLAPFPDANLRLFYSSEDMDLLRIENGLAVSRSQIEIPPDIVNRNLGRVVYIQARVEALSDEFSGDAVIILPIYLQFAPQP